MAIPAGFLLAACSTGFMSWIGWKANSGLSIDFGPTHVTIRRPWRKPVRVEYAEIRRVQASFTGALRLVGTGRARRFSTSWWNHRDLSAILDRFARHGVEIGPLARVMAGIHAG